MNSPKLSILLAVYNAERFIGSTIETVLEQSFKDWELIVQDGGSGDRTVEIARGYDDARIKIFSEKDKGQGDAIWKAVQKTSADFLTVLCASDGYLHKDWLKTAMEFFNDVEVSTVWGIPFDMTEDGVLEGPHYVFSRFLNPHHELGVQIKNVGKSKKIVERLFAKDGGSVFSVARRMNLFRLRSVLGTYKRAEPAQKRDWFKYWLRTGTVFPDGNLIVAKHAFFDCMPSCEGQKSPDWMQFFYNLNAKGYLSVCVQMPANYGRKHDGHLADELVEFNLRTRKQYYAAIKTLAKKIKNNPAMVNFIDRTGKMLVDDKKPLKLHLGAGEKYMEGYVNIDFPVGEHTVMTPKADIFTDVTKLVYPENTVDEIRSHHLFEHFSRPHALKLLARWRSWLKPGGSIIIETPDFATSAALFLITPSMRRKLQLSRHMFGSQEAAWAYHMDHWDKEKFLFVLKKMGFKDIKIFLFNNGLAQHAEKIPVLGPVFQCLPKRLYNPVLNIIGTMLPESFYKRFGSGKMPNIVVKATKDSEKHIDLENVVREILAMSLNGRENDRLLDVWMEDYHKF